MFLIKHFNFILLEAGNWCFQLVLKWSLKQINQFSAQDLFVSSGFLQGEHGWGCAWNCHFWFLWWIRKEIRTVLSQGFRNCKKEKEKFQNKGVSTCGTVGSDLLGCILWVYFCNAVLLIQRDVICKSFHRKKVWLRKYSKRVMVTVTSTVTFWDISVSLGSFILTL